MGELQNSNKDLEQRLIDFSISVIKLSDSLNGSYASQYLKGQMLRSAISPALNYGELKSAESRNDFIHKMKIILKELRETHVALKIVHQAGFSAKQELMQTVTDECNQLISIMVKSIDTAQKGRVKKSVTT